MQTDDKLTQKVEQLQQSQQRMDERKAQWKEEGRDTVLNTLTNIKDQYELDWFVDDGKAATEVPVTQHYDSVYLAFEKKPTGIVSENQQKMREGGVLGYSQAVNGQVVAWIRYPYIEGAQSSRDKYRVIGHYEPADLSPEQVQTHCQQLVDIMLAFNGKYAGRIEF